MTRRLILLLPMLALAACAGSPYGVETRAPSSADLERQAVEEKIWEQKRVQRAQGRSEAAL
ncbi:hypothetical protein GN330_19440 [Nitratireductor sp. CAU 1489]|uniref:Lipoprotein n=1 Tax=Nitratireductor arenosus TaxID=2682096 RepID=A0A844QJF1_9HYPH|nr:hypothetical protein [Nitratireductor arenosus]MVA99425.1 hypothetical protein [Nitratireductor arenosus]